MAWDGNGSIRREWTDSDGQTFSGEDAFAQVEGRGIRMLAEHFDLSQEDLRRAIQNTLTKDGQNSPTANLPMNGRRHTNVGDATAGNQYASYRQVQKLAWFVPSDEVTGTGQATILTPSLIYTAYTTGMTFTYFVEAANTATDPTVNVNGLGVKTIKSATGSDLAAGDLAVGYPLTLRYDGTHFRANIVPVAAPNLGFQITKITVADAAPVLNNLIDGELYLEY